jgi:hypothetical protein
MCSFLEHIKTIFKIISNIMQAVTGITIWPCKENELKSLAHDFYQQKFSFRFNYQCTWLDNKVRKLIVVKVLHTSLLKTTMIAFIVLPLGSYAPMPAPSTPFKTTLELVLWNDLQSWACDVHCLDARSMSCWQKVRVIFTQPFQYFQIVNLLHCLSRWYKFIMKNLSTVLLSAQLLPRRRSFLLPFQFSFTLACYTFCQYHTSVPYSVHCQWITNHYSTNQWTFILLCISLLNGCYMVRHNCRHQGAKLLKVNSDKNSLTTPTHIECRGYC